MTTPPLPFIGTAAWTIPSQYASDFNSVGSHLERYASRFNAVEINSSFYRPHRLATYQRWAATVPDEFKFTVKIPKTITHECRLADCEPALERFLSEATGLGPKLGVLLVQLPPSLAFDASVADNFFAGLRSRAAAGMACEPRHPTWFSSEANDLLVKHEIARVAADPKCVPEAGEPGGWQGLVYYRLHGSPRIYYSNYENDTLEALRGNLHAHAARGTSTWCIFDNTAAQAATGNALTLLADR